MSFGAEGSVGTDLFRRAVRHILDRRLVDRSEEIRAGSALVLAPHPDDETLACGGLIATKCRSGDDVTVMVATDGGDSHRSEVLSADRLVEIRDAEVREATARLGLPPDRLHLLGLDGGSLASNRADAESALSTLLAEHRPDQVFLPCRRDWNPDHRELAVIGLRLVASELPSARCFSYPVWFFEPWAWYDSDASKSLKLAQLMWRAIIGLARSRPLALDIDDVLACKVHALEAYRSQLTDITGEGEWNLLPADLVTMATAPREIFFRAPGP